MVECPKCGAEVTEPLKTWAMPSRKGAKETNESKLIMGMFECANCNARFRASVPSQIAAEDTVSVKNMVERIRYIKGELMQTLKNLREKIKTLETERSNLMVEIEKLKEAADSKVAALESEVGMLREEVKSLRDLLGYTEDMTK